MSEQEEASFRNARPPGENALYQKYYDAADVVEIVGIACKGFWRYLYPDYGTRVPFFRVKHDHKREARLAHLEGSALFRNLREREFHVSVFMANPFSDFVRIRAEEEDNPECRNDIMNGVDLLALMVHDLKESQVGGRWTIRGSFRVFLYDKNPYVSVFRASHNEGRRDYMAVGFLFHHRRGFATPQAILHGSEADQAALIQAVSDQLGYFHATSHPLLTWHRDEIAFQNNYPKVGRYDVFLCHNAKDKSAVKEVAMGLREHGILPWLDEWVLTHGNWVDALERALQEVGCVAVFVGPAGASRWQELEIGLSLNLCATRGLRVIPVVLKGVEGEPQWANGFLSTFQRVDFRKRNPVPIKHLVQWIRGG